MPVEPAPSRFALPRPRLLRAGLGSDDVVAVGGDLAPGTLLAAYRAGLFPMRLGGLRGQLAWWSPDPRGVLPLGGLVVSRSLRRSLRRYDVRVDTAFDAVIARCADVRRPAAWIGPDFQAAYIELHRLGWAHSVEAWAPADHGGPARLVGGLYGVAIGGLFAGESMFSLAPDASKVALVRLVELLAGASGESPGDEPGERLGDRLLDVQWCTRHLSSLGCVGVPRRRYLRALARALESPLPSAFDDGRR